MWTQCKGNYLGAVFLVENFSKEQKGKYCTLFNVHRTRSPDKCEEFGGLWISCLHPGTQTVLDQDTCVAGCTEVPGQRGGAFGGLDCPLTTSWTPCALAALESQNTSWALYNECFLNELRFLLCKESGVLRKVKCAKNLGVIGSHGCSWCCLVKRQIGRELGSPCSEKTWGRSAVRRELEVPKTMYSVAGMSWVPWLH